MAASALVLSRRIGLNRTVLRFVGIVTLAGCGVAFGEPTTSADDTWYGQPLTLDDFRAGERFLLATPFGGHQRGAPLPTLTPEPAPMIGFDLSIELDAAWPGRRLALTPHFPISRAFENGGDSWSALCDVRGRAHSADAGEILTYLDTWCRLGADRGAVVQLLPLLSAHARGLAVAVRTDVADLLAYERHPSDAMKWLDEHRALTPETLDALATSYAANDSRDESRAVLEYLRTHEAVSTSDDARCRRLQHEFAVSDPSSREQLEQALLDVSSTDPTCARIAAPLRCKVALEGSRGVAACNDHALERLVAKDIDRCRPYVATHVDAKPALALLSLRQHWPAFPVGSCHWQGIADVASHSLGVSGAEAARASSA